MLFKGKPTEKRGLTHCGYICKMTNYFELYNLPVSFSPDKEQVRKRYYELSRLYHPDRFVQASEQEQTDALRMSAANNEAYKTFNNADATMAYVLKLNGLLEEEEKYNLPPGFLMDMMDLNEAVSEYEMEPDNKQYKEIAMNMVASQFKDWDKHVAPIIDEFSKSGDNKDLLLKLKDYYFRKKYLLRIQERINTFATH